jgi:hypothetical protein
MTVCLHLQTYTLQPPDRLRLAQVGAHNGNLRRRRRNR